MHASQPLPGEPIDAVVLWVDGDDPGHQLKLNAYLQSLGKRPRTASSSRFRETGEFAFCIASLLRFAPWIGRIHIVTDEQVPPFMEEVRRSPWADRIRVVDHREIFEGFEQHLPTFNSVSIGSLLQRVPEVSERFLFLNDDFLLLRPVEPTDFFRDDGKMVLRGDWRIQLEEFALVRLARRLTGTSLDREGGRPLVKHAYSLGARRAGMRWWYQAVPHVPHPQRRSLLADYFAQHPELLAENVRHQLRVAGQFLADSLCRHLAWRAGLAVVDNRLRNICLKSRDYKSPKRLARKLRRIDTDKRLVFGCLQDLNNASDEVREHILGKLAQRIGRLETLLTREANAEAGQPG